MSIHTPPPPPGQPGILRNEKGQIIKGSAAINPGGRGGYTAGEMKRQARLECARAIRGLAKIAYEPMESQPVPVEGQPPIPPVYHPSAVRKAAMVDLLDRGFGKPASPEPGKGVELLDDLDEETIDRMAMEAARKMLDDAEGK